MGGTYWKQSGGKVLGVVVVSNRIKLVSRAEMMFTEERSTILLSALQMLRNTEQMRKRLYSVGHELDVESSVRTLYSWLKLPSPHIVWCDSPVEIGYLPMLAAIAGNEEVRTTCARELDCFKTNAREKKSDRVLKQLLQKYEQHEEQFLSSELGPPLDSRLTFLLMKNLLPKVSAELEQVFGPSATQTLVNATQSGIGNFYQRLKGAFERLATELPKEPGVLYASKQLLLNVPVPPVSTGLPELQSAYSYATQDCLQLERHIRRLGWPAWTFNRSWGAWELYPFLLHGCILQISDGSMYREKSRMQLMTCLQLLQHGLTYLFFSNVCFVCKHPQEIHVDERARLHNPHGAALVFGNGQQLYAWRGRIVPEVFIEQQRFINPMVIDLQRNSEVRRIMIEIYGWERYLRKSHARKIHKDEFGTLYRKEIASDEPIVAVEVFNSTPEPDGTRKRYLLRVPPNTQTARQAVAWTFGFDEADYNPKFET